MTSEDQIGAESSSNLRRRDDIAFLPDRGLPFADMRHRITVATSVVTISLLAADTPTRHVAQLQAAIDSRDSAVLKAAQGYRTAVASADRQLAKEAGDAQRRAMQRGSLPSANDAASVEAGAEANARENEGPAGTLALFRHWAFRDAGGLRAHWIVTPTTANHSEMAPAGRVSQVGLQVIVRFGDDWVERLTPLVNGRLLKESWHVSHGERFPEDPPSDLGMGDHE